MKESEAKKKWCPFARIGEPDISGINREREARTVNGINDGARCIGSECMAWRPHFVTAARTDTDNGFCGLVIRRD